MKFSKLEEDHDDYDASSKKGSFFSHVFSFEGEGKADILNVLQYTLLSFIPLVALNKLIQYVIPEATDEKGSFEIGAEVVAQVVLIFLGLIFIDRITTYVKTYSGVEYPKHSVLFFSLGILLVILSLQSKLGEKVAILTDRFMTLFGKEDESDKKKKKNKKGGNPQAQTVYAPDVQMISLPSPPRTNQGTTSIDNLPNAMSHSLENSFAQMPNSMDIGGGMGEPMAANSLLGGSFGSSW